MIESALTPAVLEQLARMVGVEVPAEDVEILLGALANQLGGVRLLQPLALGDIEPLVQFDPRWS
jgi:hypothetical protein